MIDIFNIKLKYTKYKNRIDDKKLNKFFKENYSEFKYFGGDIEKLIGEMKYSQSFRTFNDNINNNNMIYEDLEDAFTNFKSNRKERKYEGPPLGMYV